jgi:hypothetical protein
VQAEEVQQLRHELSTLKCSFERRVPEPPEPGAVSGKTVDTSLCNRIGSLCSLCITIDDDNSVADTTGGTLRVNTTCVKNRLLKRAPPRALRGGCRWRTRGSAAGSTVSVAHTSCDRNHDMTEIHLRFCDTHAVPMLTTRRIRYWLNVQTQETQWERPLGVLPPPPPEGRLLGP